HTPMASSARYSTDVATTTTMNSTTETANENFITDQGSIRLRFRRARRGPRAAAEETAERAERTVSETRAAPTAAAPDACCCWPGWPGRCLTPGCVGAPAAPGTAAPPGRWAAEGGVTRPDVLPGAAPLPLVTVGTVAEPFATDGP